MEQPSIEITYDPTIKVRGITEELFKQQPEGKFVLKPFTIISKKVYKNFTDRSHAFNYLLKFLKKKSKEYNDVTIKVFSEPRKLNKSIRSFPFSYFYDFLMYFASRLIYTPFRFIPSIKYSINTDDIVRKILTTTQSRKLRPLNIFYAFCYITILIIATHSFFDSSSEFALSYSYIFSFLNILYWILVFISGIFLGTTVLVFEELQPSLGKFLKEYFSMKKLIYSIEKMRVDINKKTVVIINFDIYSNFDPITSSNLVVHLLNSTIENKNICIVFHTQNDEFINSIKTGLIPKQFDTVTLFLENDNHIEEFQFNDNYEIDEEKLPIPPYELHRRLFLKRNQQLERENKEQLARLIQSAKLESMNITTSGVSHEIRNPLSIIQLVIENLRLEKNLTKETLAQDLDKIQTQISRILKLTETFQKYSTKKNLATKSIDSLIVNAIAFFEQRLISNKIEVNYDKPEEQIAEIQFSEELSIVIENLLSNAIDALTGNKDAKISIKLNSIHNRLDIVFSDNGHGIPQESIKEIFTPLYTTKGPGQGTGLGLWLCYTIVKDNLKGDIRVDSPPNGWTTFTISLPIGGDENV
ncbi:MAG: HAMP domain-containing histidine kinase [Leptospiraceae bacterium]|nr:HAMP domain-containing histidine kinase [Leptospiraceae bacterium]